MKLYKKTLSILLTAIMMLTPLFALPTQAAEIGDSVASVSSMQAYQNFLDELLIEYNISGVAYVTQNGRVLCQSTRGMQNTEENIPITIDTIFPVGSISKQFCATAILLLQEQGKLSVNDTLSMYFPKYEIGKDITIKNLLNMRSGIRDHVNYDSQYKGNEIPTDGYYLYMTSTKEENQKTITDWLFTQELKFTPGKLFAYSNSNFLLLSMIVEQVSGMNYTDFVKQNIFAPLNMTNSGFYEELVNDPNLAEPCLPEGILPSDPYFHGMAQGAGDIALNAIDLDKWMTSLAQGKLLSEESYKEMTTSIDGYGYGISCDDENGSLYHTGATYPYLSVMSTFPEKNLNIFVVTTDEEGLEYEILYAAEDIIEVVNTDTMLGNIDGDSDVTILDATAIQLHLAHFQTLNKEQMQCADTNGDGEISIHDVSEIQRFIAKL